MTDGSGEVDVLESYLATTRAVRRRLDLKRPVPIREVEYCLEIATQAPSGSNRQGWHFVVVERRETRRLLGNIYQRGFADYRREQASTAKVGKGRNVEAAVMESAQYLADAIADVPVLMVPCLEGRPPASLSGQASFWASIYPSVWSFILSARSRGFGSTLTTAHLRYADAAAELLNIPKGFTQAGLLPVAYFVGEGFRRRPRVPRDQYVHRNVW